MPRTFYGPGYSARNLTYANAGNANIGPYELGSYLITPDQRVYRFALNDGTAEVAGNLYQSVAGVTNHTNVAADVARAIGATAISATIGATAAVIDIYAEGLVHINDAIGEGYTYRIKRAYTAGAAHAAAAGSDVLTVNLDADESVQVALTTASEVSFTRNRYHSVALHASPPTAGLAGVSPGVAAANRFYWSQVSGYAAVLASGTLLEGLPVMAGITTDGSVESYKRRVRTSGTTALMTTTAHAVLALTDADGTTVGIFVVTSTAAATGNFDISGPIAINAPIIGNCIKANATTEYGLVDLNIQN